LNLWYKYTMNNKRIALIVLIIIAGWGYFLSSLISHSAVVSTESVTIDLSNIIGPATARASGVQLSLSADKPSISMVSPLKFQLYRTSANQPYGGFANYGNISSAGTTIQVLLAQDFWSTQQTHNVPSPGDNNDWSTWTNLVTQIVQQAKTNNQTYQWDIWNEPNWIWFWSRSITQWFETYRQAVVAIRNIDPNAVIVGPSAMCYNCIDSFGSTTFIKDFLTYAKANNVLPNILSWHEIWDTPDQIPVHVNDIQNFMQQNGISIPQIEINEYGNPNHFYDSGYLVWYLANLERSKIFLANRTCMSEGGTVDNCWNYSLDGLLTSDTFQPRSVWWTYKGYADLSGQLATVTPSTSVDAVSSVDAVNKKVVTLVGNHSYTPVNITLNYSNLSSANFLGKLSHVVITRIDNSGQNASTGPVNVSDTTVSSSNNTLSINIPAGGGMEVYIVQVTPSPSVTLTADNYSFPYGGGSTNLHWSSMNATSCTGINFNTNGAVSGSIFTGILTSSKTYSITCTDGSVTASSSITITVQPQVLIPPVHTCFPAGTQVTLSNGSSKSIEDIKVGDMVQGYDVSLDKLVPEKVLKTYIHIDGGEPIIMINNMLKATANHPFYVEGKWVSADKLKIGDKLTYLNGHEVKNVSVMSLVPESPLDKVYNLTVSDQHDYFANGILVHNKLAPLPAFN
jgi:hypothetical protein